MIDFLKRKTGRRLHVMITGTDQYGRKKIEWQEVTVYPRIVRWILRWFVRYPHIKGTIRFIEQEMEII